MLASVRRIVATVALRFRRRNGAQDYEPVRALLTERAREGQRIAVVLTNPSQTGVAALQSAAPQTSLTVVADRKSLAAASGARPFDLIIDACDSRQGRLRRFRAAYYLLREGGTYLVADGASELGSGRRFGRYLAAVQREAGDAAALDISSVSQAELELLRPRLGPVVADGRDLLITSHVYDALLALNEPQTNAYLAEHEDVGRVLEVHPAGPAPQPPTYSEGPRVRQPNMQRRIGTCEISLREYRDVIVDRRQLVSDGRAVFAESFRRHSAQELKNRRLMQLEGNKVRVLPEPWPDKLKHLGGTYLHLDDEFRGHFGHLLTETLSRIWAWPKALDLDPDCRVLVGATPKRPTVGEYEYQIYEAAGIPRDRIVLIDEPVSVERLISGTPLFSNPHYVMSGMKQAWDVAGDHLAAQATSSDWPERIFASRRPGSKRGCRNTTDVEALFAEFGFATIYPEDFSLGDQVAMFRAAEAVAGFGGSGIFQIALVPEARRVITVTHEAYRARNEYFIAAVRGHRLDAVTCRADNPRDFHSTFLFDAEDEAYTRALLADLR